MSFNITTVRPPDWMAVLKALMLWLLLFGPILYRKWDAYQYAKWKAARQAELDEAKRLIELYQFIEKTHGRKLPHFYLRAEALIKHRDEEIAKMLKKLDGEE